MMQPVRCPAVRCAAVFELPTRRMGRSAVCPSCGTRMTARPVGIDEQLRSEQRRIEGGPGAGVERLPLAVLVDNVRSLWNVGSIFRTADACGVAELWLAGITGCPPRAEIAKTALGADVAVAWRYTADPLEGLERMRIDGYVPVALEATSAAVPVDRFVWPERVGLVIGNEVAGIAEPVLDACPHHVRIPMHGVKDSLNVAVAFGIAAQRAAGALIAAADRAAGGVG